MTTSHDLEGVGRSVVVPITRVRRWAVIVLGATLFQLWVWGTRIVNLFTEPEGTTPGFAIHLALYIVSVIVALILGVIGVQMWRASRRGNDRRQERAT